LKWETNEDELNLVREEEILRTRMILGVPETRVL